MSVRITEHPTGSIWSLLVLYTLISQSDRRSRSREGRNKHSIQSAAACELSIICCCSLHSLTVVSIRIMHGTNTVLGQLGLLCCSGTHIASSMPTMGYHSTLRSMLTGTYRRYPQARPRHRYVVCINREQHILTKIYSCSLHTYHGAQVWVNFEHCWTQPSSRLTPLITRTTAIRRSSHCILRRASYKESFVPIASCHPTFLSGTVDKASLFGVQ